MFEHNKDDTLNHIMFLHGKESGPFGTKYKWMQEVYEVDSPDFQGMEIEDRLSKAEKLTRGMVGVFLVGSSYGGLLAALLYSKYPDRFSGYLLLAPALHLEAAKDITRIPDKSSVIHGTFDEVVPHDTVSSFCKTKGVAFISVEDAHPLHNSKEVILNTLSSLHSRV